MKEVLFESTPNPNAVKCVLHKPRRGEIISAASPAEADGNLLALELLAVPGVTRVLLHTTFVSVSKSPDSSWLSVKRAINKVLNDDSIIG
ncbi:MAG: NifU N-terminal domain-containing protein [Planctomycetota bacterium]